MIQGRVFVRPRDDGDGWAIDVYDDRGKWVSSEHFHRRGRPRFGERLDRADAQKRARELRRDIKTQ